MEHCARRNKARKLLLPPAVKLRPIPVTSRFEATHFWKFLSFCMMIPALFLSGYVSGLFLAELALATGMKSVPFDVTYKFDVESLLRF